MNTTLASIRRLVLPIVATFILCGMFSQSDLAVAQVPPNPNQASGPEFSKPARGVPFQRRDPAAVSPLFREDEILQPVKIVDHTAFLSTPGPRGSDVQRELSKRTGVVRYVKSVASGNSSGSDWANASGDLQAMLDASAIGDVVWVAAGVYRPAPSNDRNSSFVMQDGVAVYGGFTGNELPGFDLAQRDFVVDQTILSGDLLGDDGQQPIETDPGTNTNTGDNAFTIVDASGVGSGTILDGFTITAGRADLIAASPAPSIRGAGVYLNAGMLTIGHCRFIGGKAGIDATSGAIAGGGSGIFAFDSVITVANSVFTGCLAGQGPAYYCVNSTSDFSDSDFTSNKATSIGGAIVSDGDLTINDCSFTDNEALTAAGCIYISGTATIERSTFNENRATQASLSNAGGALYAIPTAFPSPQLDVLDCAFVDNAGVFGGAIYASVPLTVTGSSFEGNVATLKGAGIHLQGGTSESVVDSCTFTNNLAGNGIEQYSGGGGISAFTAKLLVTDSIFTGNTGLNVDQGQQQYWGGGGAMIITSGGAHLVTIVRCDFIGNTAQNCNGGAILGFGALPIITDCLFQDNVATYWGGGITSNRGSDGWSSWVSVEDCRFAGNEALYGGGILTWDSATRVERVVFEGNIAQAGGAGISLTADGVTHVSNTLFIGNTIADPSGAGDRKSVV